MELGQGSSQYLPSYMVVKVTKSPRTSTRKNRRPRISRQMPNSRPSLLEELGRCEGGGDM